MSYRVPLATDTLPGSVQIGTGLRVVDGVLIPVSVRNISSAAAIGNRVTYLQTTATVLDGQAIDIRSDVSIGSLTVNNRDLTIFLA